MELSESDTWSCNGGVDYIDSGTCRELEDIAKTFNRYGGGNASYEERKKTFAPLGWGIEKSAHFSTDVVGSNEAETQIARRVDVDAYKDGIVLEHERTEQMRGLWHLVKLDAIYKGYAEDLDADVGVLLIPSGAFSNDKENNGSLRRVRESVRTVLEPSADLSIPLFVWEYPTE